MTVPFQAWLQESRFVLARRESFETGRKYASITWTALQPDFAAHSHIVLQLDEYAMIVGRGCRGVAKRQLEKDFFSRTISCAIGLYFHPILVSRDLTPSQLSYGLAPVTGEVSIVSAPSPSPSSRTAVPR